MAGTVDLLQRCYLGIETRDDAIWFNPCLPAEIQSLELDIRYRQRWMNLTVANGQFTVEVEGWGEGSRACRTGRRGGRAPSGRAPPIDALKRSPVSTRRNTRNRWGL